MALTDLKMRDITKHCYSTVIRKQEAESAFVDLPSSAAESGLSASVSF